MASQPPGGLTFPALHAVIQYSSAFVRLPQTNYFRRQLSSLCQRFVVPRACQRQDHPSSSSQICLLLSESLPSIRRSHFLQTVTDSALSITVSNFPFAKTFPLRYALKLKSGAISWLHTRINMRLLVVSYFTMQQQTEDFHRPCRSYQKSTVSFHNTKSFINIHPWRRAFLPQAPTCENFYWSLDAQLLLPFLPYFLSFLSPPLFLLIYSHTCTCPRKCCNFLYSSYSQTASRLI